MEEFLKSQGFEGGVYKVSTDQLKEILEKYKDYLLEDMKKQYPNDQDLGRKVREL